MRPYANLTECKFWNNMTYVKIHNIQITISKFTSPPIISPTSAYSVPSTSPQGIERKIVAKRSVHILDSLLHTQNLLRMTSDNIFFTELWRSVFHGFWKNPSTQRDSKRDSKNVPKTFRKFKHIKFQMLWSEGIRAMDARIAFCARSYLHPSNIWCIRAKVYCSR